MDIISAVFQAVHAGGDLALVAIAAVILKIDRRLVILETIFSQHLKGLSP